MSGPDTASRWVPVIGLEVHCQLRTRTKLFCGCRNEFGAAPNSLTCPVCTGQPGALPVLNREALALAARAGFALGCDVAPRSKFDRKNYFYCDLPKGYQISQFDRPVCVGGGLRLSSGKLVRLVRIHMEEDAGKAIHDRGTTTLVDLNRAGVPLIEMVTEPDLASSGEAYAWLSSLKEILQYAGVSDCDMEKGSLRCDVNVSVMPASERGGPLRTKVEIKNLNSFRNVQAAIDHELARQVAAYETGDEDRFPVQETRLYDPDRGETRTMRGKEDAHDYRYFPEPDLPPVVLSPELLAEQRALVPELPEARRARYQAELGLSEYDAGVLTAARETADFFERTAELAEDAKLAANWISNHLLSAVSAAEVSGGRLGELRVTPESLAELLGLLARGSVHNSAARQVLAAMLASGRPPAELVAELGFAEAPDTAELEAWCRAALAGREQAIADVKAGRTKALGALVGPVMKASRGKADPERVRAMLMRLIGEA